MSMLLIVATGVAQLQETVSEMTIDDKVIFFRPLLAFSIAPVVHIGTLEDQPGPGFIWSDLWKNRPVMQKPEVAE